MDLRQLRYFDAVVRYGGFTRAAEQLHVAQPAISARIRELETELGVMLLRRTTRRVALTGEGERLLAGAREVLERVAGLSADMTARAAALRGRVRIGATEVLGALPLAALLARFRGLYPAVGLSLHSGLVGDLIMRLGRRELDLVIAPVHDRLARRYAADVLLAESLVLIAPPRHPLALRASTAALPFTALRGESFVSLPRGSGLHALLLQSAASAGFKPAIDFEASGPAGLRELVAAGLGVALYARSLAEAPGPQVHVQALKALPPHPPIGLIRLCKPALEPAADALRRHVVEAAAGLSPTQLRRSAG
jgi:DNA-binding transcriptional LysR family regulator